MNVAMKIHATSSPSRKSAGAEFRAFRTAKHFRLLSGATAVLLLAGCASTAINENFSSAQVLAKERLDGDVKWLKTDDERRKAQSDVDALLSKPLSADDAVRISLAYSPALQAMLFENAATSSAVKRSGAIG